MAERRGEIHHVWSFPPRQHQFESGGQGRRIHGPADYVLPEDIKEIAEDVLNHRILLNYEAEADNVSTRTLIKTLLEKVPINKSVTLK